MADQSSSRAFHKGFHWGVATSFDVPISLLDYTGMSGDVVMEPGPIELSAGSSSSDIRSSATITVTGETRVITGE